MLSNIDIINSALKSYVVTPLHAFGLGGFVFDVEAETTADLTTEITDHYLEDNTAIQDHIAIRPKKVTLKGFVGEVVFKDDDSANQAVQKAIQKLTVVSAFLPTLSDGAKQASDILRKEKSIDLSTEGVNKIANYFAYVKNIAPPTSNQERAYLYFKALMEGKILMSIQTPFEFMTNMAIESISAKQYEDTKYISDFTITLKEIRKVSLLTVEGETGKTETSPRDPSENWQKRAAEQRDKLKQVGNMAGLESDIVDLTSVEEIKRRLELLK